MAKTDSHHISNLLEQARLGDRAAFSAIVKLMMNPIVALTYKMTGDPDAALDLAQETFVSAWQNLSTFKGNAKFENWLYRIATNKSLNYIKREKKTTGEQALAGRPALDSPERDLNRAQLKQRLLSFMSQLPPQQKLVFELRFYKQLAFQEIADVTDKATGTVKTLYREALKKLREVATSEGWQV